MTSRTYDLPAMTTLVAFEAAARNGSFKLAAVELNVTPGAVSHQIKSLESELGTALFDRVHRGVTLTDQGRELFLILQSSFSAVAKKVGAIKRPAESGAITIGATTAMSALWLTPRITRFWQEHPEVRIDQTVSDQRSFGSKTPDLRIRYAKERAPNVINTRLFGDTLLPLASPEFAARHQGLELAEIAALPLIHMNAPDQNWTTWETWLGQLRYFGAAASGTRVNNYMIALQAAQDGVGVVLGWKRLTKPLLDTGSLVELGSLSVPAPNDFHLVRDQTAGLNSNLNLLVQWLLDFE